MKVASLIRTSRNSSEPIKIKLTLETGQFGLYRNTSHENLSAKDDDHAELTFEVFGNYLFGKSLRLGDSEAVPVRSPLNKLHFFALLFQKREKLHRKRQDSVR